MSSPQQNSTPRAEPVGFRRWLGHGAWAVSDQALASIATFAVNIALARGLTAASYGAFAVAFQCYWLLVVVHNAVIDEPMLVLAQGRYAEQRREYFRTVLLGHGYFATLASTLFGVAAGVLWLVGEPRLASSFGGAGLAATPMLTLFVLRRIAYAKLHPRTAVFGGATSLALLCLGMAIIIASQVLGVFAVFVVLGIAAGLASAVMWLVLRPGSPWSPPWPLRQSVARTHRHFGVWGVGSGVCGWVPHNIYYLLLPVLPGAALALDDTGALRAMATLIMPMLQVNATLGTLLIPTLSRKGGATGGVGAKSIAMILVTVALAYWGLLVIGRETVTDWVYGGRYAEHVDLLIAFGTVPVFAALAHVSRGVLLARAQPALAFRANAAAAVAALLFGIPLSIAFELQGAVVAIALSGLVQSVMLAWYVSKRNTSPDYAAS